MKYYYIFNKLEFFLLAAFCLLMSLVLQGCARTAVVQKSLEEGKVVPIDALRVDDFLNEYEHHLPKPVAQQLAIDIALERDKVLSHGDSVFAQVGLVTSAPKITPSTIHLLVYNPSTTSDSDGTALEQAVIHVIQRKQFNPGIEQVTADWVRKPERKDIDVPALKKNTNQEDPVRFLQQYSRFNFAAGKHHVILMLGNHSSFSHSQKQNIIDIARIFRAKSISLSVLAVGEKPEMSFLDNLGKAGNGIASLVTKTFDYTQWIDREIGFINAKQVRDINLTLKTQGGVKFAKIVSPSNLYSEENSIKYHIDQMRQGEDHVILVRLSIPKMREYLKKDILSVEVEYFDVESNRFYQASKIAATTYAFDKNAVVEKQNHRVERSLLILNTIKVLQDVVPAIRDKRYYNAVAMLTEQDMNLRNYAAQYQDLELERDANILAMYSEKLYDYDEEFFQSFKLWRDLHWDTVRYSEFFQ